MWRVICVDDTHGVRQLFGQRQHVFVALFVVAFDLDLIGADLIKQMEFLVFLI